MATIRNEHHHQRHDQGWTEPRVARLKKLYAEGKSASEIARDLGGGVTRNGVIGKVHRLGILRDEKTGKPRIPARAHTRAAPATVQPAAPRALAPDATAQEPRVLPAPLPPEPEVEGAQMVPLLELGKHGCKWPVGMPQPVQLFCGRRQHGETPYCAEHAKVAYSSASSLAKHSASELVRSVRRYL